MKASETEMPYVRFVMPTLMYHRVAYGVDCPWNVWPNIFEQQIRIAAEHFEVLTVSEGLARLLAGKDAGEKSLVLTFDDGYEDFFHYAFPILQKHGIYATVFLPTSYIGKTNIWNPKANYICNHLTWRQIQKMAEWGIEFGAHSCKHHSLIKYEPSKVIDEIIEPINILEQVLGVRPISFSYPYGVYNNMVQKIVKAHYDVAFSVTDGTFDWRTDRYAINRVYVSNRFQWRELDELK